MRAGVCTRSPTGSTSILIFKVRMYKGVFDDILMCQISIICIVYDLIYFNINLSIHLFEKQMWGMGAGGRREIFFWSITLSSMVCV